MGQLVSIEVKGLQPFRREVRAADRKMDRTLRESLRDVGDAYEDDASPEFPRVSGTLQGSAKTRVTQRAITVHWQAPYAGGAEWGRKGKWLGWAVKHGPAPRFVYPVLVDNADDYAKMIREALLPVMAANGWLR